MTTSKISLIATMILGSVCAIGCNTTQSPSRQVSDTQITTEVKTKLTSTVGPTTLANIEVNTTNGVVTLAGQVESVEVKHNAEAVASSVAGVIQVHNDLQVELTSAGDTAAPSTTGAARSAGDAIADATRNAVYKGAEAVGKAADKLKEKTE